MQFESIRVVLPHRDHYVSNKGIDEPTIEIWSVFL